MNYLLDTCVLSEYKKTRPERKVIDWLGSQSDDVLFLSVLTIGELKKGIFKMPFSKRKTDLEGFIPILLNRFDRRLLSLDATIMLRWGAMIGELETIGRLLPVIDSLIAATALEHDLTIVTRNEDDFGETRVKLLNPWQ